MTWQELDDRLDNELSVYWPDQFADVADEPIAPCAALEQAMAYLRSINEYATGQDVLRDNDMLARYIQRVAKRTTGAYDWPFVLVRA